MQILILGNETDAHAAHLKHALEQAGATVDYWDLRTFPRHLQMSWQPHLQQGHLRLPNGRGLDLAAIHSVFWRTFALPAAPPLADAYQARLAMNDVSSAVRSHLRACPARWVNSWEAYQFHKEKPLQLAAVQSLGVKIPATLVTNDPAAVQTFASEHPKLIFKPVYGGAHTQMVTPDHLAPERLTQVLQLAPVTLQAYIPGTNIRTYVIGQQVYSAEIRSPALDFREDAAAAIVPVELPAAVQAQCRQIAAALSLQWTAIDWRQSPSGQLVFLEANPSPMFIHFENATGFPITAELVKLLTA